MHNPIHFKSGFLVSSIILFISVGTAAADSGLTIGNKALKDSATVANTNKNDSLNVLRNSLANNINVAKTDTSNYTYVPRWYSMITNLPSDMVTFYRQDITVKNIPLYLGIGALTAGMIMTDNQSWKVSDKYYKSSGFDKSVSDIFVKAGDGRSQFGIAAVFAAYGFVLDDPTALRTASEVVEAVLASGAVVQVLKHITGRESPFVSTKPGGAWRFFPNQIQYHKHVPAFDAFPSGHLTTTLATFTVIAENYPDAKWIRPVGYATTALLAISMVNTGIHWYSDYPLAVFLGYEFGKIIAHHGLSSDGTGNDDKKLHLVFAPYFNQTDEGLSLSLEF